MSKEIFKDIPGYKGIYQVSNLGNVKSLKRKKHIILKPRVNTSGYYAVNLFMNGSCKQIHSHQLVAMAFLGHTPDGTNKLVINHINFDKLDNIVENLEVVTNRENCNKKHLESTSKYVGVVYYPYDTAKWKAQINIKGTNKHLGLFNSEYEAHLAYEKELKIIIKK